jgi:hypothetical protein
MAANEPLVMKSADTFESRRTSAGLTGSLVLFMLRRFRAARVWLSAEEKCARVNAEKIIGLPALTLIRFGPGEPAHSCKQQGRSSPHTTNYTILRGRAIGPMARASRK